MRSIFLLCSFVSTSIFYSLAAQVEQPESWDLDTLHMQYQQARSPIERGQLLLYLSEVIRLEDPDSALACLKLAETEAVKAKDSTLLGQMYLQASFILYQKDSLALAESYCQKALALFDRFDNYQLWALAALNLSETYVLQGKYSLALKWAQTLQHRARIANDSLSLVYSFNQIAEAKAKSGSLKQALRHLDWALEMANSIADERLKAEVQLLRGECLLALGNYAQADTALHWALRVLETRFHLPDLSRSLLGLGEVHFATGRYQSALEYNDRALVMARKSGFVPSQARAFRQRAEILEKLRRFEEAQLTWQEAYLLALSTKQLEIKAEISRKYAQYLRYKGKYQQAYELQLESQAYRDSLYRKAAQARLDSALIAFETQRKEALMREKDQKLSILQREKAIQELKSTRQILVFIATLALMLALLAFIFLQNRSKTNAILLLEKEKEKEAMQSQIARQNWQLAMAELKRKEEALGVMEQRLNSLREEQKGPEERLEEADIFNILQRNLKKDSDWPLFLGYFEKINPNFMGRLKKEFPALTLHDLRLIALIRLALRPNEIASLLNIATESVRKSRYRLARKMGLEGEKNLVDYLLTL